MYKLESNINERELHLTILSCGYVDLILLVILISIDTTPIYATSTIYSLLKCIRYILLPGSMRSSDSPHTSFNLVV